MPLRLAAFKRGRLGDALSKPCSILVSPGKEQELGSGDVGEGRDASCLFKFSRSQEKSSGKSTCIESFGNEVTWLDGQVFFRASRSPGSVTDPLCGLGQITFLGFRFFVCHRGIKMVPSSLVC